MSPLQPPAVTAVRPSQEVPRRITVLAWRDLANPAAGGSELLVDRLSSGLADRGHEVTLLCGGPEPSVDRNYRVVSSGGTYDHFLRTPGAFGRSVGETDLLVEVCNGVPYLAPLWHRGPVMCLVNHVHTDLWDQRLPGPVARAGRMLEHRALTRTHRRSLMVAVSPSTAEAMARIGVPADRIHLVPNGVEAPGPLLPESDEPLFTAVGRLVEYKRIDLLLRLWERVRPITGGKLVIVGDGPERDRLEAQAGPDVIFAGRVDEAEKHRLLCRSWLLLHPSSLEGWGLVVTEAAIRGTPAVGFEIPGLRDSVVHGRTGLLARAESGFAAAWCALALSAERRSAMGAAARHRAEQFTWEHSVDRFQAAAAEAVALHSSGRTGAGRTTAGAGPTMAGLVRTMAEPPAPSTAERS
ncbi:glycosyltransferase family 4 protein [Streptomyces sp. TBY4]|uniref:glycosyltransferase family 4 protein n=1 Tax=Streptomyces sp. TBY4 TaxID=2962030 RepID=UPI0020B75C81|nr:glycosyltransferase family 4 protein [Streptomyces sp. TBY4]MCP3754618.1 glycosyltransferase family 4 protein [Streptomyces sp. TBY4]